MTKLVLPRLLEKGKGVIVNLSSCVSTIMPPMLTGYAATKVNELITFSYYCFYDVGNSLSFAAL